MDQCVVTYGEFMRERNAPLPAPTESVALTPEPAPPAAPLAKVEPWAPSPAQLDVESDHQNFQYLPESIDTTPAMIPTPPVTLTPDKPSANGSKASSSTPPPMISATIKPPPPRLAFSLKPGTSMPHIAVGITGYKLKPLFDFIIDQAGGDALPKVAAQLAVYRVFRRVPRELVLADNINSLNIADPTIEVHNKELYDAIVRAIEATFGVKYDSKQAKHAAG